MRQLPASDGDDTRDIAAPGQMVDDPRPDEAGRTGDRNRGHARIQALKLDTHEATHNHKVVDSLSETLAALSDPTRRAILARLRAGPASVTELSEPFGVSQQAISKHLAYLERARLVRTRREGREHLRELNAAPIRAVADWTADYREYWNGASNRLRDVLDRRTAGQQRRKKMR